MEADCQISGKRDCRIKRIEVRSICFHTYFFIQEMVRQVLEDKHSSLMQSITHYFFSSFFR